MNPLPIDDHLDALCAHLDESGAAVLVAEPGAGKTTRVPPRLADRYRGRGRVLVLEPRRLAARAAADRMAREAQQALGERFGYRVRDEGKESKATEVLVVTEGLFLRRLLADPSLEGVAAVVFDEFHERHLDGDLALALCEEVRQSLREDLEIVVMSATLDPHPIAAFLNGAGVLSVPGRTHPVETYYRPAKAAEQSLDQSMARVIREANDGSKGILAFLPGMSEIRRLQRRLEDAGWQTGRNLFVLHGELSLDEQSKALQSFQSPRVVLATNVAESSLTVPNIDVVVDSGFMRRSRRDPDLGLARLEVERISMASADQRRGRAGRLGPGRCFRLWSALDEKKWALFEAPEIQRLDLAEMILAIMDWGVARPQDFKWFEAPPPDAMARDLSQLVSLGFVEEFTEGYRLSSLGRRLASLPIAPRLARLADEAAQRGAGEAGALCAAILSEGGRTIGPRRGEQRRGRCDLLDDLDRLEAAPSHVRKRLRKLADRIERSLSNTSSTRENLDEDDAVMRAVFAAYPDRLARRRQKGSDEATMVGGRGLRLAAESGLRDDTFFVALDLMAGRRGASSRDLVRRASAVDEEWLEEMFPDALFEGEETVFDREKQRVVARRVRRFFDLVLSEKSTGQIDPVVASSLLARELAALGDQLFQKGEGLGLMCRRLELLQQSDPSIEFPVLDATLIAEWSEPYLAGRKTLSEALAAPFVDILRAQLGPDLARRLDREMPTSFELPNGRRLRIDYPDNSDPVASARVQHLFGVWTLPLLARGKVPLLLDLLAPNQRPVQRTSDLSSFWTKTYTQVRKDLRGRYPKHDWPEIPPPPRS